MSEVKHLSNSKKNQSRFC